MMIEIGKRPDAHHVVSGEKNGSMRFPGAATIELFEALRASM
jgi:hypothetical protein